MPFPVIDSTPYLTDEATAYLVQHECQVQRCTAAGLSDDEFRRRMEGVQAVVDGGERWTADMFEKAGDLKVLARRGVGWDSVDVDAAARNGVWVTNTPGATDHAVADFTLGLMIGLLRNIPSAAAEMKAGEWHRFRGKELRSLTIGIVGTGAIGKQVIARARGFGARILANDVSADTQFAAHWAVQYVSLDDLMAHSDIVSLHCALNESTRALVNSENLKLMKRDAYLVNTSRAQVIDKDALIEVLQAGAIAGAAIDVHDPAPCAPDDPLVALDNVIATPWTAYNTVESVSYMCMTSVHEAVRVLEGHKPMFPVNQPEIRP